MNVGSTRSSRTTPVAQTVPSRTGIVSSVREPASKTATMSAAAPRATSLSTSQSHGTSKMAVPLSGAGGTGSAPHSAASSTAPASSADQASWLPSQKLKSVKCADPFARFDNKIWKFRLPRRYEFSFLNQQGHPVQDEVW